MRTALMLGLKCGVKRRYFKDLFGFDVVDGFGEEMHLLTDLDLVEIDSDTVRLTKTGSLFTDKIGQLFYSQPIRERMIDINKTIVSTTLRHRNPFVSINAVPS